MIIVRDIFSVILDFFMNCLIISLIVHKLNLFTQNIIIYALTSHIRHAQQYQCKNFQKQKYFSGLICP